MFVPLISHLQSPPEAVQSVVVEVKSDGHGGLALHYVVRGDIDRLAFAPAAAPERQHRLWQLSCFEIFLKVRGEEGYQEYNFSSSRAWAAYGFTGRRAGMLDLHPSQAPEITSRIDRDSFVVDVMLSDALVDPDAKMLIGLSTIIEEKSGTFSYWAIAHPDGPADFHHPDCFALTYPFEDIAP
jgi:hypothetical protein